MKISVFITSYNQKDYLVEAINSVLGQTFRPHEIIIVDDCSTDGSIEVIAGYASRYSDLVKPIYQTHNQGISRSRIKALQAVTGDYATYLDGDDRFLPSKLEKEATLLLKNPDCQIAFSNYYYITAEGVRTGMWADGETPPQGDVFCEVFAREFPKGNIFRNELVHYPTWRRIGFHDPNLSIYEDWEMRIRLSKQCKVAYYDEPLSEYRLHSAGLSHAKVSYHLSAFEYIYEKNGFLTDDLPVAYRDRIRKILSGRIADLSRKAAEEALINGQNRRDGIRQVVKYQLKCFKYQPGCLNHKLILKLLLPHRAQRLLRAVYHERKGKEI